MLQKGKARLQKSVIAGDFSCPAAGLIKKKILSGISFAKINKNLLNYPLKLISLAIRKQKNQSEIVLQSGISMTYQQAVQTDRNKPHVPKQLLLRLTLGARSFKQKSPLAA